MTLRCSCIWDVTELPFHRVLPDPECPSPIHPGDEDLPDHTEVTVTLDDEAFSRPPVAPVAPDERDTLE